MNSKLLNRALVIAAIPALAGCAEHDMLAGPSDAPFGEANRQTMMAQVVNPEPVYETELVTSGEHAAQAVERYRTDAVKQPDSIRTTDVGEGGPN